MNFIRRDTELPYIHFPSLKLVCYGIIMFKTFQKELEMLKKSLLLLLCCQSLQAAVTIPMYQTTEKGQGAYLGSVTINNTAYGLLLTPNLHDLTPGLHGFHVHQMASCSDAGMAAGGHLDPQHTDKHLGPYSQDGHLGDLPALYVDDKGNATLPELAPRLTIADVSGHALMIHAGGDNYSDVPEKLGGGGPRVACGVIPPVK